jgi:hypothetical protein
LRLYSEKMMLYNEQVRLYREKRSCMESRRGRATTRRDCTVYSEYRRGRMASSAGILEQLTWARNQEGIGLSHIKRRACTKAEEA